jgi:hypothetical protein
MKKILLLTLLVGIFISCNDDCTQDAYSELLSTTAKGGSQKGDKVFVCHNGSTLEIDVTSLQDHLDHGDTEGECGTLSNGSISFGDGIDVEVPCDWELPRVITDKDTNKQYWITIK